MMCCKTHITTELRGCRVKEIGRDISPDDYYPVGETITYAKRNTDEEL